MKQLLILIGLFTSLLSHAQTFKGQYASTTTQHYKNGVHTSNTTKFTPGNISIDAETIKVDTSEYTILKHGSVESADEGQFVQSLIVITTTKRGTYKALDCVLLLKPNKTIAEVMFKKSKSSIVSYLIN